MLLGKAWGMPSVCPRSLLRVTLESSNISTTVRSRAGILCMTPRGKMRVGTATRLHRSAGMSIEPPIEEPPPGDSPPNKPPMEDPPPRVPPRMDPPAEPPQPGDPVPAIDDPRLPEQPPGVDDPPAEPDQAPTIIA